MAKNGKGDAPSKASTGSLTFPVVGIGASAGGIVALRRFLEQMPARSGMAFVVILHLSPKHESNADAVLQQVTRMPVVQVQQPLPIEADHVYVISPQHDLEMVDGYLSVQPAQRPRGQHVAIDLFFRTLADVHRDRAVGVVLSGTGADGALGIARIKEQGGVTIAQLPEDSEYADMPRSAIATGKIDFILPATEIPQRLVELWRNARQIALPGEVKGELAGAVDSDDTLQAEKALRDILEMLAARSGHDFRHYKRATVLRRIERRLQVNMLKDLPSYRDFLRNAPQETSALLDDMLISVTNFFRDREAFEALERDVIPGLFDGRGADEQVRVWTPGSASGEEAYSLAMLLADQAAENNMGNNYQVFASDIDETAIGVARAGSYPASVVADIPPARLRRYFSKDRDRYRINQAIRDRVLFAAHNVLRDPPFSRIDLISCRNLLIYLDRGIQSRLLEVFYFALRPGGFLFLGNSESADAAEGHFEVFDKKHRIYRPRAQARGERMVTLLPLRSMESQPVAVAAPGAKHGGGASFAEVHRRALEHYRSPSVIIDRDYNIVHMSEGVGQFLQHPAGEPSRNLVATVREELRIELRMALFQALHTSKSVEAPRVQMDDGTPRYVSMIVQPFRDPEAAADFLLVSFLAIDDALGGELRGEGRHGRDEVISNLESELQRHRATLQATVEQSETSSEELKASNEELQAINEELRSATEELETSKEELQSVNEELTTVNYELKTKVEETAKVNDDLQNFIASAGIATVFVDPELRIKRYTPQADAIFNILPGDIGRRLLDITHNLDYPCLADDANAAFSSLQPVEREVRSTSGKSFIARALPYRTAENRIDGAVLTFVDVTNLRNAEELANISDSQLQLVASALNDHAVIVVDTVGNITAWNVGAQSMFGWRGSEVIGKSLDILFVPEDVNAGKLQQELATATATGFAGEDRWHQTKDGERIYCTGSLTRLESDQFKGFVKVVRDGTIKHAAEKRVGNRLKSMLAQRAEVEAATALKDDFIAIMSHELKNPLNLISVSADILGRVPELRVSEVSQQSLSAIRRAVRGQTKIIDDLLDMSRIRTGKFSLNLAPVDLVGAVQNMVEIARADSASSGLDIRFDAEVAPVIACVDASRLEQIVWNLLSNAIKFTPAGGVITVSVTSEDGQARMTVSDTGQGIEPALLSRIFDMFGQAQGRALRGRAGLGIGLSLVRQLVDRHGGRILASSDGIGHGATFTVWLPVYQMGQAPVDGSGDDAAGPRLQGLAVLIVEDADDAAVAMARLLEMEGATVSLANNGEDGLLRLSSQPVDVVLSDIGMPGMDGYEFAKAIRSEPRHARLPLIALTGFGRDSDVERAKKSGFDAHISKPVSAQQLIEAIHALRQR